MIDDILGNVITVFFEDCRKAEFSREITMLQGGGSSYDFDVIRTLKNAHNQVEILDYLTALTEENDFRFFVLDQVRKDRTEEIRRWTRIQLSTNCEDDFRYYDILISETKEYLSFLNWDWYVENNCCTICKICDDAKDWRWILLDHLYKYYKKLKYGRFLNYSKHCPLDDYLVKKGVKANFSDNYGLLDIYEPWVLKSGKPAKVYIPEINNHVILRHTPSELLAQIDGWRHETKFNLALRPDYNICGDKILDLQYICEERDFGKNYSGQLSKIDQLSKYFDRDWANDWLLVQHNGADITFEEVLEDGPHDQDNFVTQVVHIQFIEEKGQEFITHIDHEYAFYSEPNMEAKRNKLQTKGEARTRYKTFKIDKAHIPYVNEANYNILYKVLTCYFTKGELLDEYFRF